MHAANDAGIAPAPTRAPVRAQPALHPAVAQAWLFATAVADRAALRVDLPYGHAHLNTDVPASAELNGIRVETAVPGAALIADAVALFPLGPRHIVVRDPSVAVALRADLQAAGYRAHRTLLMSRTGPGRTRPRTDVSLWPATGSADADLDVAFWTARRTALSEAELAQLRLADLLRADVAAVTRSTVWSSRHHVGSRTAASRALSATVGAVTEISRVFTAEPFRGAGLATTATLAALAAAPGTVFARVAEHDPAVGVLARCGMGTVGHLWEFTLD